MTQVKKILLSKLLNVDVPLLLEELIEAMNGYDLEALRLQEMYNLLLQQAQMAKQLGAPYGKHVHTKELARLHKKRLKYASLINMQVKSFEGVDDKDIQRMAMAARGLTKKYLTYLGRKSNPIAEQQIDFFFAVLDTDKYADARQGLVGLGLQPYMDELEKTNMAYKMLFNKRKQDLKDRPRMGDPTVKRETLHMMRLFIDQVNSNQRIYKEVDYDKLVAIINVILTRYSKYLKTRIATHKRRARKKAEAEKESAVKVTMPVSEKEVKSTITVESNSANGITIVANATRATTKEEQRKPQPTNTHQGTKGKQIPVKDLVKVVKRGGQRKRRRT